MGKTEGKPKEININKIIKDTAKQTAKETIEEFKNSRMIKREISYYRKIELLLYNYNNLKEAIKQKDEDIEHIKIHGLPQKSKSIVIYQTGGGSISGEDRYLQLIEKYGIEKLETERDLARIRNAINKIKEDKYFDIIQYKYLNEEAKRVATDEALAEILKKDRTTICRNRSRLMNKLITILFPESIRDLI